MWWAFCFLCWPSGFPPNRLPRDSPSDCIASVSVWFQKHHTSSFHYLFSLDSFWHVLGKRIQHILFWCRWIIFKEESVCSAVTKMDQILDRIHKQIIKIYANSCWIRCVSRFHQWNWPFKVFGEKYISTKYCYTVAKCLQ